MNNNIYITGFMGSGKTTIASRLAEMLNRKFVDMDEVLEKKFGCPISEYFAQNGEEAFRKKETDLLRFLSKKRKIVASTGGGAPISNENRNLMNTSGTIVHLKADFETCAQRLAGADLNIRPMWKDPDKARELYDRRMPFYEKADIEIRVDDLGPEEAASRTAAALIGEDSFNISMGGMQSTVISTWDGPDRLADMVGNRRVAILTDKNVASLHLDRYLNVLNDPLVITVPAGEKIKSFNRYQKILETLLDRGFNRDDLFIALGGGTVTDLGAFVAATFKRGMNFILISTTLLGCVDASVGGKAGINLGRVKNSVGCFTVPEITIFDVRALMTLKPGRISEGLVEAYKTGLVAAPDLAELIEKSRNDLKRADAFLLSKVVSMSARAKADVVGSDFTEKGRRAILNLGHTYGHAVEGWHKYKVSHGRAVARGLLVATALSKARGLMDPAAADEIEAAVHGIAPNPPETPPLDDAWEIMQSDKKIKQGRLIFVLLSGRGNPVLVDDISKQELGQVI